METNLTENNNLSNTDLIFQDEYFCDKNIDRTKFFIQSINIFISISIYLSNKKCQK